MPVLALFHTTPLALARGTGRDSEQKVAHTDGSGAAGPVSRSVTATTAAATTTAAAAEALNVGGNDSRTARDSTGKSIFDTFGVTLPKGSGPRDWASSPSSEI